MELVDIAGVAEIAHQHDICTVIDNVFATPLLQKPLELGADVVAYSATKHIDGQGRCLGGMVLGSEEFIEEKLKMFVKQTGPSLSPFNAWNLLKGLETLPIRVERATQNAAALADHLAASAKVGRVFYPGRADHPQHELAKKQMSAGGPMVAFDLIGDKSSTFAFLNALNIIKISNNLGDAKSLITHPATTTHHRIGEEARAELGIGPTTLRVSTGLEDIDDLKDDIDHALAMAKIRS